MTSALGDLCCWKEWHANNTPGWNVFVKDRLRLEAMPELVKQKQVVMGLRLLWLALWQKLRGPNEKSVTPRMTTVC